MKRFLCAALAGLLAFTICACAVQSQNLQEPVRFYYRRAEITNGQTDSVIAPEEREAAGHTVDLKWLLAEYLKGPQMDDYVSLLPAGTTLVDVRQDEGVLVITLSDSFAQLTGLDLTIACACLTMTVLELTDAAEVTICTQSQGQDGTPCVTMDRSCFVLLDTGTTPVETTAG